VLAAALGLHADGQMQAPAQVGDVPAVLEPGPRELGVGLAHPPQRALDPGPLLLDERLDLVHRKAARHDHLDAIAVDEDARVARPLRAPDAIGDGGHRRRQDRSGTGGSA
jgi:hypothetical protein